MATYQITAPDGSKYRLTGPDNASHDDLVNAVIAQHPMAGMTTEELENAPRASTSIGDIGRSFGMGLTGAAKSLTDVFGAGSGISNYLGDITQGIEKGLTPARKEEMARREELVKRAQGKGLGSELYANLAGVLEAPVQSIAQAAGSSVPSIVAGLAALPEAAPAGIVLGVDVAARALMGAAQGVGETKGDIHDQIKQAYLEKGLSEADAEKKAIEAQSYTIKTAPLLIGGAAFGALDAATGLQSSASRALREAIHPATKEVTKEGLETAFKQLGKEPLTAPSGLNTFLGQAAEEGIPEGLQGGYGQLAQNVAMQQQGFETPTFEGVAGASARDALVGALTGGAFSPMAHAQAQQDFQADKEIRARKAAQEEEQKRQARLDEINADLNKKREEARVGLGVDQVQALLPAPAKPAEKIDDTERLNNPLGNLTKDELHPDVAKYIDKYRKDNGMPKLNSYSIEDVKDAMTSENPEGEQGALDSFIAAKTGYTGQEKYTPDDVINAAVKNNVAPDTQGFKDFLTRTTGISDLNAMSQPQLYSAFKSLMDLNRTEHDENLILPEGTNASRYNQKQYDSALKYVTSDLTEKKRIRDVLDEIKGRTGLDNDRDAQALLNQAVKDEDLTKTSREVFNVTKDGEIVSTHDSKREAQVSIGKKKGYEIQPETVTEIGPKAAKVKPEEVRTPLPQGYEIQKEALQEKEEPKGHAIIPEGQQKALTTVPTLEGIQEKIDSMQGERKKEAARILESAQKHQNTLNTQAKELTRMEALGQGDTEAYKKLSAQHARAKDILTRRYERLGERIESLNAPLKSKPFGKKVTTREVHTVIKNGKKLGSFPSSSAAMKSIVAELSNKELTDLANDTRKGAIKDYAKDEIKLREAKAQGKKTSPEAKERILGKEMPGLTAEAQEKIDDIEKALKDRLKQFGLGDVGLKLVDQLRNNANGSYNQALIKIALTARDPIKTLRHESLHALKDLGFFTDSQWKSLEKQAKETWVNKYLKNVQAELDGEVMSRYDAYKKLGLTNADLLEEAIADAFADFKLNNSPPPGMIAALFKRLENFFKALREAFTGVGLEKPEDIFSKIERGELKSLKKATEEEKLSLGEVPRSTRFIMEQNTPFAQAELGLNGKTNKVRDIGIALNEKTKGEFGQIGEKDYSSASVDAISKAIADEVTHQLGTTAETGTGLGWYSNNYPNAVKLLGKRFPELKSDRYARSVFSAIVAVTSNGERVNENIKNAIEYYAKVRNGEPLVAMSTRRATALENNLATIQKLMDEYGPGMEKELLREISVKEMNAELRNKGEETDGSYLAHTMVPAAAIYFGPKLGAFYANLSGAEGYLTMDLWWSRSINRMRGLLLPKATDASINKFRDMMGQPNATRDEVVAATIPLRNKYEEYGYNTELEHLTGSKEPSKKAEKPDWFKKAKRKAGAAYQQLLFEHDLEKMANTIYKNEYDMMEEAPFNASDRAFMYDAARRAQKMLKAQGKDLSLADIQAALWYYEKRLYAKLSGRKADDIGYEEAIIEQSKQSHRPEGQSVVFTGKYNAGNEPAGKSGVSNKPGEEAEEKLSLNTYYPTAKEAEDAAHEKAPPETHEFKLFFGASKAKDEGRPQVMYHGTDQKINQFRENVPIFVSSNPEFAEQFANRRVVQGQGGEMKVYPLWVRAETPFDYTNPDHVTQVTNALRQKDGRYIIDGENWYPADIQESLADGAWNIIESKDVQDILKKNGFDSFYVMEQGQRNLAVFSAYQVKSATGNIGEFGINKDIRFSLSDADKEILADGDKRQAIYNQFSTGLKDKLQKSIDADKNVESVDLGRFAGKKEQNAKITAGRLNGIYQKSFKQEFPEGNPVEIKTFFERSGRFAKYDELKSNAEKFSLPPLSKDIEDRINETTTRREEKGYYQRMTEAITPDSFSYFRQKALNGYNQFGVLDKRSAEKMGGAAFLADQSAEAAALMSDLSAGVTASALGIGDRHGGIPVFKNGYTTIDTSVKGFTELIAPLAKKYQDPAIWRRFQFVYGAKRGKRLDAEGREHNFTRADYAYAEQIEKDHPEFEQVMKDFQKFNQGVVKYLVDTQVLTKEQGEEYVRWADYIPFYRQINDEKTVGPQIFNAISGVKQPKKLKGGEAPLADFLETVVRNTQSAINAGMKNHAALQAIKVASSLNDIERVKPGEATTGANIIQVLENGKKVHYRTGDPLFVDAIKSLNMPELPFMSLISTPSNILRNFVTKDPGFMLANMMRDSLSAWVTSGKDMKPVIGTLGQFTKALKGTSPEFEALMNAGILGGYEFSQNVEASGKTLEKDLSKKNVPAKGILGKTLKTFDSIWEGLEKGTTASDAATRALVYERVLKETGNEAEALYRALEVMNFNRKGNSPVVRILTAAVPFLNARFQGLDVFFRTASGGLNDPNAKQMQKAFIKRGLLLMGLTAMYYACVQGDPDYEKQEEETKDNYWLLPSLGIKIPIPFEVGVLFKVLPERLLAYSMGNNTGKDLMDSAARNLANTFAFNPIPQAVKPLVEDVTNFNFFTMRPIVGQGMEGLEPKYQVGPNTSITAKKLGEVFNHSPLKIDNMIRGYFGAVGTYATDLIDAVMDTQNDSPKASKRLEQMAVFKRFMMDKEARGNITAYYSLKDEIQKSVNTMNFLEKSGNADEFQKYVTEHQALLANKDYINDLEKTMKGFREMRKQINGMAVPGDEKLQMLTELGQAENNLTLNIKEVKKLIADQ